MGKDDGETLNGTVFIDFLETTKRIYGDLNQRNISNLIMDVSRNGCASFLVLPRQINRQWWSHLFGVRFPGLVGRGMEQLLQRI